jgi:hypothetical protein
MAILINDFEVVPPTESPLPAPSSRASDEGSEEPREPQPRFDQLAAVTLERLERVRAH